MQDRLHHRGNVSYTLCEQYSLGPFTLPSIQWPLRWMKETRPTRTALKTSDAIIWAETRGAFPCQHFRKFRSRNKWNTSAVSVEISGQSGPSDPTETCRSISKTSRFQSYFVLSSNQNFGRSANGYRSGSIFFFNRTMSLHFLIISLVSDCLVWLNGKHSRSFITASVILPVSFKDNTRVLNPAHVLQFGS